MSATIPCHTAVQPGTRKQLSLAGGYWQSTDLPGWLCLTDCVTTCPADGSQGAAQHALGPCAGLQGHQGHAERRRSARGPGPQCVLDRAQATHPVVWPRQVGCRSALLPWICFFELDIIGTKCGHPMIARGACMTVGHLQASLCFSRLQLSASCAAGCPLHLPP